jgi:hypothetical protein
MRPVIPLAAVLALALAGCSDGAPATPPELSAPYTTVDGEYQQAKKQLDLPAGDAFPDHLPNTAQRYVPGSGANQAQNFWLCAWLRDFLAAAPGDTARAQRDVNQLPRYTAMSAYTAGLRPEGRSLVDAAIQGAQRGDRKPVAGFVDATCGGPFYSQAGGGTVSPGPSGS